MDADGFKRAYLSAVEAGAKASGSGMARKWEGDALAMTRAMGKTRLHDPLTKRLQWNRGHSTVDLKASDTKKFKESTVYGEVFAAGCDTSKPIAQEECAKFEAKNSPWVTQPFAKGVGWEDKVQSCSQLPDPQTVYSKTKLPVRTASKVQLGEKKWLHGITPTTKDIFSNEKNWVPPDPTARFNWERTSSKVKVAYSKKRYGGPTSTEHYAAPGDDNYNNPKFDRSFHTRWNVSCEEMQTSMGAKADDTIQPYAYTKRPFHAIAKGPVNAQACDVDVPESAELMDSLHSPRGPEFLSTAKSSFQEWEVEPKGRAEHVRTKSTWQPGSRARRTNYGTSSSKIGLEADKLEPAPRRFMWDRHASNINVSKMGNISMKEASSAVTTKVGTGRSRNLW